MTFPGTGEGFVRMTIHQLEAILSKASNEGARQALAGVALEPEIFDANP